jgi:hypothetical protein
MTIPSNTRESRHAVAAKIVATYSRVQLREHAQRSQGTISVYEFSTRRLKEVVIDALIENYRQNPLSFEWDWKRLEGSTTR